MKKIIYVLIGAILLALIGLSFLFKKTPVSFDEVSGPSSASVAYPAEFNYRQTVNDCGPFNTAAIVRALTGDEVSSAQFAEEIGWRLPNNYTIPVGLERQLRAHGLSVSVPKVQALSDEEKIAYLQQELSAENPIIILGERDGFQHYITLFGFDTDQDAFYVYDSFLDKDSENPTHTIDENGDNPGNRTYSSEDLLDFWRGGGMYGLYEWYAIVAKKPN